jgi:hypothetical protein
MGTANSLKVPLGVSRPILLAAISVNQKLPFEPTASPQARSQMSEY